MDADVTASCQLINGLLLHVEKSDVRLTPAFSRHACAALLSKPLLQAALACNSQQQQHLVDTSDRLFTAVTKLVTRGSLTEQALALQVFTACLHSCGLSTLLSGCVGWGTQLAEALKQSGAAANTATVQPAATELAETACRAAAVLFRRLRQNIDLPGVRREVTSIVPKLLPQLLAVLQARQSSTACQAAALQLLAAVLQCVPAALRTASKTIEQLLHKLVMSTATDTNSSTEPGHLAAQQQLLGYAASCIALLPAVPGDAASWSDMMRRLLVSSHDVLDFLLLGLESRPVDVQYRTYLSASEGQLQDGAAAVVDRWLKGLPWQQQETSNATGRQHTVAARLLIGVCLSAVHHLLQQPFPVPVPVPGYSLSLLAARLLQFDAATSVAAGAVPASSTMYQELLVLQPQLQQAGWGLLQHVVAVAGHQLQLHGLLMRLVRQGLRTIQFSGYAGLQQKPVAVRCYVYSTAADVLRAAGLAGVRGLAAEAIGCAVLELYGHSSTVTRTAGVTGQGSKAAAQRPAKRAKTSAGSALDQFDPAASAAAATAADDEISRYTAADNPEAQTAALQMIQQLLESGGQLLLADLRAQVDAVVIHMAQTAAAAALCLQQQPALSSSRGLKGLQSLQTAAYGALLASILVPCSSRPPFLGQALLLFKEGRSSPDPCLSALCSSAAVQIEALLHPRAVAMSSVKQYPGMEAVPALTKPLMWSVLDEAAGRPAGQIAGATAVEGPLAAGNASQQQQQQQPLQSPAGAVPLTNGVIAVTQQASTQKQQQQQPLQTGMHPVQAAVVPEIAASGAAAADPVQQQVALPSVLPQPQQHQQALTPAQQQQPQIQLSTSAVAAGTVPNLLKDSPATAAAVQSHSVIPAPVADGGPAGTGAASLGGLGLKVTPQAGLEAESSDSEGPLPEIDSGSASESEESQ